MIYGACIAVCREVSLFAFNSGPGWLRQRSEGLRDAVMAKLSLSAPEPVHRKVINVFIDPLKETFVFLSSPLHRQV